MPARDTRADAVVVAARPREIVLDDAVEFVRDGMLIAPRDIVPTDDLDIPECDCDVTLLRETGVAVDVCDMAARDGVETTFGAPTDDARGNTVDVVRADTPLSVGFVALRADTSRITALSRVFVDERVRVFDVMCDDVLVAREIPDAVFILAV